MITNCDNQQVRKQFAVGIVGCGRVAEHHLKFLSSMQNVSIVGIADTDINRARELGGKHRIQNFFASLDELLNFAPIDVLHIVTPPHLHFDQAVIAIEKGINVFVEKPITLNYEDAQKLYVLADDKKVRICPDYIHLFNPIVLGAKAAIQKSNLGKLISAESYMSEDLSDPALKESIGLHWSFKLPGGVMQNYITHPLYLVLEWIGKIKTVTTFPQHFGALPQGLTDHVDVLIRGEKATGKVTMTFTQKYPNYYLKLFFERGTVTVDFVTQTYMLEKLNNLPRAVNRVLINFSRSRQLMRGSAGNVISFLRKKMVPYHGLRYLIESFYAGIETSREQAISKELALGVSYAEENILREAGKVLFRCVPRPSTQEGITKKERVLVTGGSGYVGNEIVRQLVAAGYYLRAYVRETSHTSFLENMGIELVFGDIREAEKVKAAAQGVDVIVHIAAAMKGSRPFMIDCSVKGTQNIAEAAEAALVKRVIYISSFSVYDYCKLKNGSSIREDSPLEENGELRGAYSLAKRLAENIALSCISEKVGPAWTILRPALIFGNGHSLASVVGPAIGNFVVSFGPRGKHLKLVHVCDVANAVILALEQEKTKNKVFNITHNDMITVGEFVSLFLRTGSGKKPRLISIPYSIGLCMDLAFKIVKLFLGRGPSLSKARLCYLSRDLTAESTALQEASGWRPSGPLAEQLRIESEQQ